MANYITPSKEMLEQDLEDKKLETLIDITKGSAVVGAAYYFNKEFGNAESSVSKFYQKLLGTEYLQRQLNKGSPLADPSGKFANQSLVKSMLSQLMAVEEASPLHILRTLQLSNIINPYVSMTQAEQEVKFSKRQVLFQKHYFEAMAKFANKDLDDKAIKSLMKKAEHNGLIFKAGKLYVGNDNGGIGDTFAKVAKLSLANIRQGSVNSPNQMFLNYSKAIGGQIDLDNYHINPLVVMGADSEAKFAAKWGQSWFKYALETGMRSLDNPLAGVEEMMSGLGADRTSLFQSKAWLMAKRYLNINLGTNGDYNLGIRESLVKSGKNIAIKSAKIAVGYEVLDSVLRTVSPSDGLFSNGLFTGLVNMYADMRIDFAKVWSDRFQGYKKSQEQAAPGSTNISALLALPLSGAMFGAQMGYFGRLGKTIASNADEAADIYNVAKESKILSSVGIKGKFKPMKRNAYIGALAGAALALPFLPGALIGSSSEELRELYSGDKEVAQKANRWWVMGGNSWEGSHTKFFSKHFVARVNADATDKVRYGDDDTKKKLNPLLHPFSYLQDPYKFEKMHAEDMPYPIWGMDVGYGSIFGKLFERTVGQIIKPDVINPAIYDLSEAASHFTTRSGAATYIKNAILGKTGEKDQDQTSLLVPTSVNRNDASLINAGLLSHPEAARYNPNFESAGLVYQALTDLVGIKGWAASFPLAAIGIDPSNVPLQLARSGEATAAARDLVSQNLGDMAGMGEFQRKILGTSSGSIADRLNPLTNNLPSWLPSTDSQYYINFRKGNAYDKIPLGEERIAGKGFGALNQEVEGVDPEDYSLAYKYKVLADVAKGSREHIRTRQNILQAYNAGKLSDRETEILEQTLEQEQERDQKKTFYEPSSVGKRFGYGPIGYLQSSIWDFVSRNSESPLEMLTPIRPSAKFLHNRTAIQDYVETQLGGTDAAVWTNYYSHFLKPTLNKTRLMFDGGFRPEEKIEKDTINEYFDKMQHIKNRSDVNPYNDSNSVVATSMSGLNTADKVMKFKKSLSDDERDYFESFSKETSEKKRDMIRSLLPSDVLRGYEQIWRNVDIAKDARERGVSVQKAIAEDVHNNTNKLSAAMDVSLSERERQLARDKVKSNSDSYFNMGFSDSERIQYTEDELLRLKMADMESLTYLNNSTGIPSKKFMGWDPRLKTDDIKIRTLSIGGEDLKRFGFWQKDEERMNRLEFLKHDNEVVQSLDEIKHELKKNRYMKQQITDLMFKHGFKANNIDVVDSSYGDLIIEGQR